MYEMSQQQPVWSTWFSNIKTVCLHYVILEMHSFPMSAAKHFYDNPLSIYLDPKIVLIYHPHPVYIRWFWKKNQRECE
jgi:hypothetical protein